MNDDGVCGGFTGLGSSGEAPEGRDASEEDQKDVKGKSLGGSKMLLGSEGRTCQCSSSGGGVGCWVLRDRGMRWSWWRGCNAWG